MGNTSGAVIVVHLDNDIATPGTTMTGTVYLEVFKDSISADYLDVQFNGKEFSKVVYDEKHNYSKYDEHTFFNVSCKLFTFPNGQVLKGRYEYPFSFHIPKGLPARQGDKNDWDHVYHAIRYNLETRLHRHGILTFDVKNETEILMCDAPRESIKTPCYQAPETFDIYYWCCSKTGTMTLGLSTEISDIAMNDKLGVNYVIHNDSTSTVKALTFGITELAVFNAKGYTSDASGSYPITRIPEKELTGVKKLSKEAYSKLSTTVDIDSLRVELDGKENKISLQIPVHIRPDYDGKLGKISHSLFVQIATPFCVDDPFTEIPIRIYGNRTSSDFAGVTAEKANYTKPNDWNAVSEKRVELNNATPLSSSDSKSVAALKELLTSSNQWNETYTVEDWISSSGDVNELSTGSNLADIYKLIKNDNSYIRISDHFCKHVKLTCEIISSVAAVAKADDIKVSILNIYAPSCTDKSNAKVAFETLGLGDFALSLVLSYYK